MSIEAFETWWQAEGQFCRAGGGDYEKTFAFRAFEFATERAAAICNNEAEDHAALKNMQASIGCDGCAAAIRAGWEKT